MEVGCFYPCSGIRYRNNQCLNCAYLGLCLRKKRLVEERLVKVEDQRVYLELICANFLAGRTQEETPEEILLVIHRLLRTLPPDYQAALPRDLRPRNRR